jgi:hypothetical protein
MNERSHQSTWRAIGVVALPIALLAGIVGCGTSSQQVSPDTTGTPGSTHSGDIPDTAVYLTYHGTGYSLKYVEGWTIQLRQSQAGSAGVLISDKDSSETVAIAPAQQTPLAAAASADLSRLSQSLPKFHLVFRRAVQLPAGTAIRAQYQTLSPRDPVTGKRVPVIVDRYFIPGSGKRAVATLATPVGVDNVDAFRLIARSFRWN